jgi:hypothetical protein
MKVDTVLEPPTLQTAERNEEKSIKYVVLRDGFRVEDAEYDTPDDPVALATLQFWTKISQTHSCGEKTEIVQYDSKKHRVW